MANRKISDLTALTAPVTGDLLPIVDISEAAAADKNKKITYGTFLSSVPLGTAAAPSIAFTGDINTGIYSPGADQVAISTGGTDRMRITSAGDVGIGTTSPSTPLHVIGSTFLNGTQSAICNSTTGSYITFQHNGTSVGDLGSGNQIFSGSTGDFGISSRAGSLALGVNAVEKARFDTSGRLLVGGSADSGGALLQVFGDRIRIGTAKTPASASATGTAGEICWDVNYIYVCTATNTWKRTAIATW